MQSVGDIRIAPISGALGAEIRGVDLAATLDESCFAAIRRALLDHLVIFFPDQRLSPDQQRDFAARFGEVDEEPFVYPLRMPALEGHPEVYQIVKEPRDRSLNLGGFWHADVTYRERPNLGSVVYIKEAPTHGGDTLFSNQYLACETLSEGMKEMLEGLRAVHTSAMPYGGEAARFPAVAREHAPRPEDRTFNASTHARASTEVIEHEHPVVRRHPESGRRSLYVNRAFTSHFSGMSARRAAPCSSFSGAMGSGSSSPAAIAGGATASASGTTAACCTSRSTTTMGSGASCTASPFTRHPARADPSDDIGIA